jgi:uncharacterized membrane protein
MEMGSTSESRKKPVTAPTAESTGTRKRVADRADQELAGEKAGDVRAEAGTARQAERLDEIRRRIETGYYERDDVRKLIAERLGADLRGRSE